MIAATITIGRGVERELGSIPRFSASQRITIRLTMMPVRMKTAYHRIDRPKSEKAIGSWRTGTLLPIVADRQTDQPGRLFHRAW